MHRRISVAVVAALLPMVMLTAGGPVSAATTVEYPGPDCPHDGTHDLQTCIDSVVAGSTVILTSEINSNDAAGINKDLTLKATNRSLHPRIERLSIITGVGDPSIHVTVQDVSVNVGVEVTLDSGADHVVRLRRLVVGKLVAEFEGDDSQRQGPRDGRCREQHHQGRP